MTLAYGLTGFVNVPSLPVIPKPPRNPTSADLKGYVVGQLWVNTSSNTSFQLTSIAGTVATWVSLGSSSGTVDTVLGTANQVTVTTVGNTATASLPSAITAPGSLATTTTLTAGTTITATAGNITATLGNVVINGAARQLQVHGGAVTDFIGTGVLVAGTVTIANTNIAATDRIFISRIAANASTTLGEFSYTISAGASFTVTSLILGTPASTQTADVSSFAYFIVRQV